MFLSRHELCDKMRQVTKSLICLLLLFVCSPLGFTASHGASKHHINFNDVPVIEFIRFVSKISGANFLFDHRELEFNVTLSSGKEIGSDEVVQALVRMLKLHGFAVTQDGTYFVIHKCSAEELRNGMNMHQERSPIDGMLAGILPPVFDEDLDFSTYKLRYHQGDEIEGALKKIAIDMKGRSSKQAKLVEAIHSIQWVKATNSLFFTGDQSTVRALDKLIQTLDIPRKQVFIEVLVLETDSRKTTDFGLQWVGGGTFKDRISFGAGNFAPRTPSLLPAAQAVSGGAPLTGLDQIPMGRGFDLGIIGDLILHKGKTFLTIGSLVSALQLDHDVNIILNQKLITQDNRNSTIFSGDNIPYTGSIVQTIGSSQQTMANIEYRDVGVNLSITPMLGEDNVITLDIAQEITEAIEDPQTSTTEVEGIRTTKTNMKTYAHVPDNHFLVLSGMGRNARSLQRAGIPCLGGLPVVGAAFSRNKKMVEKKNVLIFVRPHVIESFDDYVDLSQKQEGYARVAEPR